MANRCCANGNITVSFRIRCTHIGSDMQIITGQATINIALISNVCITSHSPWFLSFINHNFFCIFLLTDLQSLWDGVSRITLVTHPAKTQYKGKISIRPTAKKRRVVFASEYNSSPKSRCVILQSTWCLYIIWSWPAVDHTSLLSLVIYCPRVLWSRRDGDNKAPFCHLSLTSL